VSLVELFSDNVWPYKVSNHTERLEQLLFYLFVNRDMLHKMPGTAVCLRSISFILFTLYMYSHCPPMLCLSD
jgi:hypothetical protein